MDSITIGRLAAFLVASLIDGTIVPIPVELFVVSAALIDPSHVYLYAVACVIGSLVGAPVGRRIGRLQRQRLQSRRWFVEKRERVQDLIQRHGAWGVALCSATPFPFPVVTLSSGLIGPRIGPFLVAVVIGRAVKFFGTAFIVRTFGEHMFHERKREALIALLLIGAATFAVVEVRKRFRARAEKAST